MNTTNKSEQIEKAMTEVMEVIQAHRETPLDLRHVCAIAGGDKKILTLAIYRLIDTEKLRYTTDRRVALPDVDL